MDQPFDIFSKAKDSIVWRAAANSLDEAKAVVEQLSKSEIGAEFVILNQHTLEQMTVKPSLLNHSHTSAG